jgi:mono/diheme cytochrome c family protein
MRATMVGLFLGLFGLLAVSAASAGGVEDIYSKQCASCHGKDGKAQTTVGKKMKMKDLTDAATQAAGSDADWEKAIKTGVKAADGKTAMPAYPKIADADVKGLVKICRDFKGK